MTKNKKARGYFWNNGKRDAIKAWRLWLVKYGDENFLKAFLHNVEGAESTCIYCRNTISVDVLLGGGIADWSTEDGDFGCEALGSPSGSHMPRKRITKI